MARAAGQPIPPGWPVDAERRPTTDPETALGGALVRAADHTGWALGLMMEALAVVLTGAVGSLGVSGPNSPDGSRQGLGQLYLAIAPAGHGGARSARVAGAVADDPDVRTPGAPRRGDRGAVRRAMAHRRAAGRSPR